MSKMNLENPPVVVALVGNPNCGKTSLFNALTGASQKVANYPGVTVEKKEGEFIFQNRLFRVVDLPGIYSLSAYSEEEMITRQFLLQERPDVVVDVVDGSNLERNLYLTVQLLEMGVNLVVALNMADELKASGREIDLSLFSKRIRAPVVETIGHKGEGKEALKNAIFQATLSPASPPKISYHAEVEEAISRLVSAFPEGTDLPCEKRYCAIKLLEGDPEIVSFLKKEPGCRVVLGIAEQATFHCKEVCGDIPDVVISDSRYGFAAGLIRETSLRFPLIDRVNLSEKIDAVLTHRFFSIPIFLSLMYLLFWLVFTVGEVPMGWIESGFGMLGDWVGNVLPEETFFSSFIRNGFIGGVGGVIVFLPNILLLFLGIAVLEDTGYMSRAAFIMDRVMHQMGLHGKSFIPMLISFGCTGPGIMSTRILENHRDRLTTMLVLPLMSCGGRLPIYTLLIPAFFPSSLQPVMLFFIYLLGIVLAAILAKLLRISLLRGEETPFVMELPPYRLPTLKGILHHMWERTWIYIKKAGTLILAVSLIIWLLSYYPRKNAFEIDRRVASGESFTQEEIEIARASEQLEYSILGRVGQSVEPFVKPMGFDWRLATAFIGAFTAKEIFVAQIGIIFSLGDSRESSLREKLKKTYTPLVGVCILVFCLIGTPCIATVVIMSRESGSIGWAMFQFWGLTFLAYLLTTCVYQTGKWLGF